MPGAYFITICAQGKKPVFWDDSADNPSPDESLPLTDLGKMVDEEIQGLCLGYGSFMHMVKYVVMPNHIHMLLTMESRPEGACPDIRYVIRLFKRSVSRRAGTSVWQKGFYDRIVRDDREYREIWKYIDENPMKWKIDRYYSGDDVFRLRPGDEGIAPTPPSKPDPLG